MSARKCVNVSYAGPGTMDAKGYRSKGDDHMKQLTIALAVFLAISAGSAALADDESAGRQSSASGDDESLSGDYSTESGENKVGDEQAGEMAQDQAMQDEAKMDEQQPSTEQETWREVQEPVSGEPGVAEMTTVVAEEEDVTRGALQKEVIGIKPQMGVVAFRDNLGTTTSRLAGGFALEGNLAPALNKDWSSTYIGLSSGLIYSHLGDPTSNFVGANPGVSTGGAGANLIIIPANLKIGRNISDSARLSVHGGGNVVYRSVANSMNLGASSGGTDSTWKLFPNVGADAEFAIGKSAALMFRPDFTLTPGDVLFTGTVAVGIPLG